MIFSERGFYALAITKRMVKIISRCRRGYLQRPVINRSSMRRYAGVWAWYQSRAKNPINVVYISAIS